MNWPKLVVEYGQAVAWIAIFLSVLLISFLATRHKLSLARRLSAGTGCLVAVFVVYESVGFLRWATAKVNPLKPETCLPRGQQKCARVCLQTGC